ncbi:MAG: phytoene desaturase family protein [Polyangiaceae bacterium]
MSADVPVLAGERVVVIGAGFGGLSAAAHLADRGARVTVLEASADVGGKAGRITKEGFVFDTGPTVLTMPDVVRATFAAAGMGDAEREARVPFARLDPVCHYAWDDGTTLDVWNDDAKTAASIARFSPRDARHWPAFRAACRRLAECAGEPYLEAPFDGMAGFSRRIFRKGLRAVALGMTLGGLDAFAKRHFESEKMRDVVRRFATYAGASPFEAGAAYGMVVETEVGGGAFYPRGGMFALASTLRDALARRGVAFRTGTPVARVDVDEAGRVVSVTTEASERIPASAVVCNVEPDRAHATFLRDLAGRSARVPTSVASTLSLSGFAWLLGVRGRAPLEHPHTVLFADDYREEFRAIFERRTIAEDTTVYVEIASRDDDSRAPPGDDVLFVLANAPPLGDADDDAFRALAKAAVRRKLARHLGEAFFDRIVVEAEIGPRDIAKTGATGGAIYGHAPHGTLAPFARPTNRVSAVPGLYFAGGGTHPGGGVPLVLTSGRFAVDCLCEDVLRSRSSATPSRPLPDRGMERR